MERPINEFERALLNILIHPGVPDREKWLQQANTFPITVLTNDDSLVFVHPPTEESGLWLISEAEYLDSDGITAHFSTMGVGDFLRVVDVYKDDGSLISKPILLDKIDVFWPAHPGKPGWWE